MQNGSDIRKLTKQAKTTFALMNEAEASVYRNVNLSNYRAWQFGKLLTEAKEKLPHGNFMIWRAETFPDLHVRKAQKCQELFMRNSNLSEPRHLRAQLLDAFVENLDQDSLRQYRLGFVPEKSRPEQNDDRKFSRPTHYSSILGECNKLRQRVESGQTRDEREAMRKDFEEFFRWLYPNFVNVSFVPG